MSLATPQVVTINAVATDYHRVSSENSSSTYKSADGAYSLRVSHQETKTRFRRMARLDVRIVAADPLTAENSYQTASVYFVVDEPIVGFTDAQITYYIDALKAWLSAANEAAILAGRH